jgi:hypothetical protein
MGRQAGEVHQAWSKQLSVYNPVARDSDIPISHQHTLEKRESTRLPIGHAQTRSPPTSSLTSVDGINVSSTA